MKITQWLLRGLQEHWKVKSTKIMAHSFQSYPTYLGKLLGEYNNTYGAVSRKTIHADYSGLAEKSR